MSEGHRGGVTYASVSPDFQHFASFGLDGDIKIFDYKQNQKVFEIQINKFRK